MALILKKVELAHPVVISNFSYEALEKDVAGEARVIAQRITNLINAGKRSFIEIGKDLLSIKERLPHGTFGPWLDAEFGWTQRTAQNYMNVAKLSHEMPPAFLEVMPQKLMYAIAAPNTPSEIRASVLVEVEEGTIPDANEVISQITAAKKETKLQKEKQLRAKLRAKMAPEEIVKQEKKEAAAAKRQAKKIAEHDAAKQLAQQAADDAVTMLRDRLGSDFSTFKQVYRAASYHFGPALEKAK